MRLRHRRRSGADRPRARPARAWTDHRERARAAGIDDEVGIGTKPDLTKPDPARRMLTRVLDAGVPAGWLTADEVYEQEKRLRVWCEQYGLPYVLATRSNDTVATVDWRQRQVRALIAEARPRPGLGGRPRWRARAAALPLDAHRAAGRVGPRLGALAAGPPQHPADSRGGTGAGLYVCAGPAAATLEQLIAVAGSRWRIEECFQAAKNEAGLASCQVRDYTAWYRHITLAMLAHAYLSATRATNVARTVPAPSGFCA